MRFNLFKDNLQVSITWPHFTVVCTVPKHFTLTLTNTLSQKPCCQYYYNSVLDLMTKFRITSILGVTIWFAYRRPRKFAR